MLQLESKSRSDWATTVLKDLKELKIEETFEEIKLMSKKQFSNILKVKNQRKCTNLFGWKAKE